MPRTKRSDVRGSDVYSTKHTSFPKTPTSNQSQTSDHDHRNESGEIHRFMFPELSAQVWRSCSDAGAICPVLRFTQWYDRRERPGTQGYFEPAAFLHETFDRCVKGEWDLKRVFHNISLCGNGRLRADKHDHVLCMERVGACQNKVLFLWGNIPTQKDAT